MQIRYFLVHKLQFSIKINILEQIKWCLFLFDFIRFVIGVWVGSWRCCCFVTWVCYQLIAKPVTRELHLDDPTHYVNALRPRQNGRRFADNTFKCIFLNENLRISIKISLKFVPKGRINNNRALVQIMAWRRSGDKPLSEPMMVSLLTHICVTRPQWVNCAIQLQITSSIFKNIKSLFLIFWIVFWKHKLIK